jgi:probable HAF family extracellular repeat protein
MLGICAIDLSRSRSIRLLSCLFGSVILASAVGAGQAQTVADSTPLKQGAAKPTTYRVFNLRSGDLSGIPVLNSNGQAAFSVFNEAGLSRTWFYDGAAIDDIGTLGGSDAYATGINKAGQVAGLSSLGTGLLHAYVWSKGGGMMDLGSLPGYAESSASAINNLGQVVGHVTPDFGGPRAFLWSAAGGMEDLGAFTDGLTSVSTAEAINDAGLVAGTSNTATDDAHAFAWTRTTGLVDLGTLGGPVSYPVAVGAEGQVAGYSTVPGSLNHAFIWNRSSGMTDLGTAGGLESFVLAMSANGHAAGAINVSGDQQHAFSWTHTTGIVDLGTLGGAGSRAIAVNNNGQVVGGANTRHGDLHAFVWAPKQGMVDLNKRLRHAPAGLVLDFAVAIADNGWIVSTSNAGLVLLKPDSPDCGCKGMHTAGPIEGAEMVEIGAPFDTSVSFAGEDTAAKHNVIWTWGDGSGEQGGNARQWQPCLHDAGHLYGDGKCCRPCRQKRSRQPHDRRGRPVHQLRRRQRLVHVAACGEQKIASPCQQGKL